MGIRVFRTFAICCFATLSVAASAYSDDRQEIRFTPSLCGLQTLGYSLSLIDVKDICFGNLDGANFSELVRSRAGEIFVRFRFTAGPEKFFAIKQKRDRVIAPGVNESVLALSNEDGQNLLMHLMQSNDGRIYGATGVVDEIHYYVLEFLPTAVE